MGRHHAPQPYEEGPDDWRINAADVHVILHMGTHTSGSLNTCKMVSAQHGTRSGFAN